MRDTLNERCQPPGTYTKECEPTSFFSNGVPGMGTSAFTGKDSGCSGMLKGFTSQLRAPQNLIAHVLGNFPDKANVVLGFFAKSQDSAAADADTGLANSFNSSETVVVRP